MSQEFAHARTFNLKVNGNKMRSIQSCGELLCVRVRFRHEWLGPQLESYNVEKSVPLPKHQYLSGLGRKGGAVGSVGLSATPQLHCR